MEQRGSFALLAALLDFVPGGAEEFDVGANFFVGGAAGRGAYDEAAGITAAPSPTRRRRRERLSALAILRETPM